MFKVVASKYWVSALGVGFLPKAPGTFGSFVGMLLWVSMPSALAFLVSYAAIFISSVFAGYVIDQKTLDRDPQYFVLDEVLGVGIPLFFFHSTGLEIALSFLLFRLFDIWKPFPVSTLDHFSHAGRSSWQRVLGIILDDIAAGLYACFFLALTLRVLALIY